MFRMLVTDIDDTLLAHDGSLPEVNREVLARLHERGIVIVFCSGRADASIQRVASRILPPGDDEYYIAFNGARVVTAGTRQIVTHHYVQPDAVADVVAYAREHRIHIQGYQADDFIFETGDAAAHRFAPNYMEKAQAYARSTNQTYHIVDDIASALAAEGSPKLLLMGEHEELVPHRDAINELGHGRLVAMFSKPNYLEVVADGINKGAALRELATRLGISVDETLALGDGDNDADMLAAAGVGLAVANARADARAAADVVLETDASDGVMPEVERRYFS
jgi:Cof subfamily protein (haloacid dehalogenase superfamily)